MIRFTYVIIMDIIRYNRHERKEIIMRKTHTEAQARYDKVNRRVYGFRLHNVIDADIIARLAEVDSMQGYIKQLIRDDISRTSTCSVPDTKQE